MRGVASTEPNQKLQNVYFLYSQKQEILERERNSFRACEKQTHDVIDESRTLLITPLRVSVVESISSFVSITLFRKLLLITKLCARRQLENLQMSWMTPSLFNPLYRYTWRCLKSIVWKAWRSSCLLCCWRKFNTIQEPWKSSQWSCRICIKFKTTIRHKTICWVAYVVFILFICIVCYWLLVNGKVIQIARKGLVILLLNNTTVRDYYISGRNIAECKDLRGKNEH